MHRRRTRSQGVVIGANLADRSIGDLRREQARGFTLIEICIVLVITGILALIGIGSLRNYIPRYRLVQTAKTLQNDIRALQVTAIERNRETRLYLVEADADWADAGPENEGVWHLQVGNKSLQSKRWDTFPEDTQEDGSDDRQGEGLVDIGEGGAQETPGVSLQPWSSLSGPGTNNADAIVFSPRGWVTNPASDFDADGYITLTLINKRALADGVTDSIDVKIARSGMVRLQTSLGRELGGGAAGTAAGSTL